MQVTKLSDFLKAQGLTPDGSKSTYQAFIDNFDKDYFDKATRLNILELTQATLF